MSDEIWVVIGDIFMILCVVSGSAFMVKLATLSRPRDIFGNAFAILCRLMGVQVTIFGYVYNKYI